jgi:uncharacterized protein DUF488
MPAPLLTIGERHGVEVLADVRSVPYSRFNPQFNQVALKLSLLRVGILYAYFGRELGGWPAGPPPSFQEGIGRVSGAACPCSARRKIPPAAIVTC